LSVFPISQEYVQWKVFHIINQSIYKIFNRCGLWNQYFSCLDFRFFYLFAFPLISINCFIWVCNCTKMAS
jgi:hypothetical protein